MFKNTFPHMFATTACYEWFLLLPTQCVKIGILGFFAFIFVFMFFVCKCISLPTNDMNAFIYVSAFCISSDVKKFYPFT